MPIHSAGWGKVLREEIAFPKNTTQCRSLAKTKLEPFDPEPCALTIAPPVMSPTCIVVLVVIVDKRVRSSFGRFGLLKKGKI